MKRPNSNVDSRDNSKRHVTDQFDRSFETVSTIESLSDPEDPTYNPNERFTAAVIDNNDENDNFFAQDDTLVMSFDGIHSNIVSEDDTENPPTSDPIAGFTDDDAPIGVHGDEQEHDHIGGSSENYPQNILDGLDDWRPTPGFRSSTQQSSSSTLDDDEILSSFVTDDDGLDSSQQQQQQQQPWQPQRRPSIMNRASMQERTPARIECAPIPDFRLQSASLPKVYPKIPVTANKNSNNNIHHRHHHHRHHHQDQEYTPKNKPLDFKTDGPAADILRQISRAAEDHAAWESKVRAEMAKLGSLPQVCSLFDNATLFRVLDSWVERGLIFGRCVQVRPSELAHIMQQASGGNSDDDDDDMIEDLVSQPATLPPYTPIDGEQEYTFLFSFAHMPQITSSVKTKFLQEECAAVWTPWTVVSDTQREVYVATRFLTYSMY
ncbi:hypothetical protein BDB00DRAFT_835828 [Zychaea mexicana]|uniref:uncharacterized protein n=1 Tax=Zychaea mexicana TaxID=64656 RepID=UPI0022FEC63B|nr:uncharacterized protein BDB00DRAFT_835828 [Zychaea mexicana]KAI9490887.1 hypothetical protein BDB00DRAFT_835828 [Zychaea mexicana]